MPSPSSAAPDLEALAGGTAASLARIWDEIGLPPAERSRFLTALSESVVGLYNASVAEQLASAAALREEVAQLQLDIKDLQEATGQEGDGVVCFQRCCAGLCVCNCRGAVALHRRLSRLLPATPRRAAVGRRPHAPPLSRDARAAVPSRAEGVSCVGVAICAACRGRVESAATTCPLPPSPARQLWDARSSELTELQATVVAACAELCEAVPAAFACVGAKMTAERVAAYSGEVARLAAARAARRGAMDALCQEIAALWADFDGAPSEDDALGVAALAGADAAGAMLGWGPPAVAALEAKCAALQAEVADREARITGLGQELTRLWHHLCVPEAEQRAFLERHAGISDATFDVVTGAIARMQADFAARLTELLAGVRGRIAAIWDEMRAGERQRAEMFPSYFAPAPGAWCSAGVRKERLLQRRC